MSNKKSQIRELYKLETEKTDWSDKKAIKKLEKRRKDRLKVIKKLLKKNKVRTPSDLFRSAMILHHSDGIENYGLATMLSYISMTGGSKDGRWLYARAIDRLLLELGLPQKFGTQFEEVNGKWRLCLYDKRTTDKERKEFLVPTLRHQIEVRAKELDKEDEK